MRSRDIPDWLGPEAKKHYKATLKKHPLADRDLVAMMAETWETFRFCQKELAKHVEHAGTIQGSNAYKAMREAQQDYIRLYKLLTAKATTQEAPEEEDDDKELVV